MNNTLGLRRSSLGAVWCKSNDFETAWFHLLLSINYMEPCYSQVEAVDTDEGSNSQISYSIVSGNLQNSFNIDGSTGEIKVARDIDREHIQQFVLGVQGKDGKKMWHQVVQIVKEEQK